MFLLVLFVLVLITYIIINYIRLLNYWKKRNVKFIPPLPLIGNLLPTIIQTKSIPEYVISLYNAYPKERYCGIFQFGSPMLLIRDPELIKTIGIKEFSSFADHAVNFNEELDPMWGKNLFASQGAKWRNLRQLLSPVFTSKKMKTMYILMENCIKQFIDYINESDEEIMEVELESLIKRFTMDAIATTAFGIETNSLKEKNNEFFNKGVEMTDFSGLKRFKLLLNSENSPYLTKLLNLKMINDNVSSFFHAIIKNTMETRVKQNIVRPDFVHLLMEARKGKLHIDELGGSNFSSNQKDFAQSLTDEDITAQALVFIFGGYDTTAKLITFCLYELAANPDIQERLREEVETNYRNFDKKIGYEDLFKMKYLDMVVSETLRKWPAALFLDRKTGSPFTIEPETEDEEPVHLQVGDICWFPVFGLHRDPNYWPNPDTFDPERFNEDNRDRIVQGAYLPFGLGPRNCIGSRYALMKAKLLIFHLLSNFEVVPTRKSKIPLEIQKNNVMLSSKDGFWFGVKKRQILKSAN